MNYIPVKLDKTRNMLFGFGALQLFKKLHGKSLMKIDFEQEDIEEVIPLMIFAGLKHEDESLTLEETVSLIDKHLGMKGAMELLPEILGEINPEMKPTRKNSKAAAKK